MQNSDLYNIGASNHDGQNQKDFSLVKGSVLTVVRHIAIALTQKNSRSSFFTTLSQEISAWYPFDRLSINLYDSENEVLCFFTAAEGTIVSALSSRREANQNTVAGKVINTKKPVVISNLLSQFHGQLAQPMTDAGLNCTMAFPLMENNQIIGTLHCSFAEEPAYFMELINFMVELVPFIAIFLSHVLTTERLQNSRALPQVIKLPGVSANESLVLFDSDTMKEVMSVVNTAAPLNIPVFITGETGTGKTMLAKYIHENSPRASRNFIKVNCPSIAPNLIETELFGHARGSFTGAAHNRIGRVELAQQGTLFLDEVAELPPEMQSKFLQVIEEKEFERVGESTPISVDFRLIAATNQDIKQAVIENRLRRDFYYRLAVVHITLPPLRNRVEDIPILFEFLANKQANAMNLPQLTLPSKLMNELKNYYWPGNIREMRNVINRLLIKNITSKITLESIKEILAVNVINENLHNTANQDSNLTLMPNHLPKNTTQGFTNNYTCHESTRDFSANEQILDKPLAGNPETLEEIERKHIVNTIKYCKGVIAGPEGAASKLGIPRTTLQHKMRKLGINKKQCI